MMLSLIIILSTCTLSFSVSVDWNQMAYDVLKNSLDNRPNTNIAKNVILFIGDGLGMSTITASRIYKGQQQNNPGEETVLKFEEFPNVALLKTYCLDRQVPDSACTATAMMAGVKINFEVVGLNENVKLGDCAGEIPENKVDSILQHFKKDGRSVGVVTNTRLTHATPSSAYANSAYRELEDDSSFQTFNITGNCKDIAYQFVYNNHDIQRNMEHQNRLSYYILSTVMCVVWIAFGFLAQQVGVFLWTINQRRQTFRSCIVISTSFTISSD